MNECRVNLKFLRREKDEALVGEICSSKSSKFEGVLPRGFGVWNVVFWP